MRETSGRDHLSPLFPPPLYFPCRKERGAARRARSLRRSAKRVITNRKKFFGKVFSLRARSSGPNYSLRNPRRFLRERQRLGDVSLFIRVQSQIIPKRSSTELHPSRGVIFPPFANNGDVGGRHGAVCVCAFECRDDGCVHARCQSVITVTAFQESREWNILSSERPKERGRERKT